MTDAKSEQGVCTMKCLWCEQVKNSGTLHFACGDCMSNGKDKTALQLLAELEKQYDGGEYYREFLNKARELCGK